ncbi:uncharacterized protein HMPREF1541_04833 [Cyphellophora europaea CBS 101466]|uniref:Trafficking protein particle complex subunit 6B n=1 Tax=Cyphellophora europaea (strain CBS 101466) TaxID=1220924 RepID=W2RVL9_CYPE1|nr:uncharacterized protein HMPREF1541_04833 [Cyphellophora europaea CBS 101466]ETN40556.1 hypothetical protein HMPREF1541_04833 [Cyphellophora europaea CBS 101466]
MAQTTGDVGLDPAGSYVNISCFDLLLIELVPLAERMAREYEASLDRPSFANRSTKNTNAASTTGGAGTVIAGDGQPETELFKETMYYRLESLGYRVGLGLSERFSRDRPRITDQLDVIKFLCKDLWMVVFKKQIDNLKTNHRGVFVLTDSKFRPFSRMSMVSAAEAVHRAQPHLIFPCGIIRGALASLGVTATVQAETQDLPAATFQIKTAQAKP